LRRILLFLPRYDLFSDSLPSDVHQCLARCSSLITGSSLRPGQQRIWRPIRTRAGSSGRPQVVQASPRRSVPGNGCGPEVACCVGRGIGRQPGDPAGRDCLRLAIAARACSASFRTRAWAALISRWIDSGITRPSAVRPIVFRSSSSRTRSSPTQGGSCWAKRCSSSAAHQCGGRSCAAPRTRYARCALGSSSHSDCLWLAAIQCGRIPNRYSQTSVMPCRW